VVQVKNTQTGAVATGTTTIPLDDTIPQNTEGTEFMTLAITPTSSTNKLKIEVVSSERSRVSNLWTIVGVFQDSTASASRRSPTSSRSARRERSVFHALHDGRHHERDDVQGPRRRAFGSTDHVQRQGGGRLFGGVIASSITITEIVP
jgi:hypothetical protein